MRKKIFQVAAATAILAASMPCLTGASDVRRSYTPPGLEDTRPADDPANQEDMETELASPDGKYTITFDVEGTNFYDSNLDDNYLLIRSYEKYGDPEVTFTYMDLAAENTAEDQRDMDKEYYDTYEFSEVAYSNVTETEISGYKAYWYSERYADEDFNFKACNYYVFIELEDKLCIDLKYARLYDITEDLPEGDEDFQKILGRVSVDPDGPELETETDTVS